MFGRASSTGNSIRRAGSGRSASDDNRPKTSARRSWIAAALLATLASLSAWLSIESIRACRQRAVVRAIWYLGGYVARRHKRPETDTHIPRWYRTLFGDDFMDPVIVVRLAGTDAGDEDLLHVGKLSHLEMLDLRDTRITDAGLQHLRGLNRLKVLILTGTAVTDQGLAPLGDMPQLTVLSLEETKITDRGLQQLKGLANLGWLNLSATQITDAGLSCLKEYPSLDVLVLERCATTREGLSEFRTASPAIQVYDGSVRRGGFLHFYSRHLQQ